MLSNPLKYPIVILLAVILSVCARAQTPNKNPSDNKAINANTASRNDREILASIEAKPTMIMRERYHIVNREAKFIKHPNEPRWFLVFDTSGIRALMDTKIDQAILQNAKAETKQSQYDLLIEVLPCKWLMAMIYVSDRKDDLTLTFRIWGVIYEYKGRNYILPSLVATEKLFEPAARESIPDNGRLTGLESIIQAEQRTSDQQKQRLDEQKRIEAMTEALRAELLKIPRPEPLELPPFISEITDEGANSIGTEEKDRSGPGAGTARKWKDNQVILDREGRIQLNVQSGQFLFLFDSDSKFLEMPPVVLMPCRQLEQMENIAANALYPLRFRISGTVVKFQGKDYLLLEKTMALENERRTLPR